MCQLKELIDISATGDRSTVSSSSSNVTGDEYGLLRGLEQEVYINDTHGDEVFEGELFGFMDFDKFWTTYTKYKVVHLSVTIMLLELITIFLTRLIWKISIW